MTDKLSIYNGALNIIGERRLANVNENRETRFKLDDIFDNDFKNRLLQMGQWNFAARSVKIPASTTVTPTFGYEFAFPKPDDFVRTMRVAFDDFFKQPITRYNDESQFWFMNEEEIFVQYVSNDVQFGGDFSLWPFNFTEMAEHYLAYKVAPRLTGLDLDSSALLGKWKMALREAKAVDGMEAPARWAPQGAWASSRQGFRSGERGKRTQLIG